MIHTFAIQLTTLLLLFVGSFVFGLLPLLCVKVVACFINSQEEWIRKTKVATFLLYVGGGVFLSNSFLVLLPKARQELEIKDVNIQEENSNTNVSQNVQNGHHHDSFPIPEFIVLCSFFVAYILQEILYVIFAKINKIPRKTSDVRVRFCSCAKRHTECSRTFKDAKPDQTLFGLKKKLAEAEDAADCVAGTAAGSSELAVTSKSDLLRSSIITQPIPNYGTVTNISEPATDSPLPVLIPPVLLDDERRLALDQHTQTKVYNTFLISSMMTIIALALQFIFRGINVGFRATSVDKWPLLVLSCLQIFILIFSLGSELAAGSLQFSHTLMFVATLSCASPVGIILVMSDAAAVESISPVAKGIVASISCGTLLYTTFYQTLRQERSGSVLGLTKFFAVTLGAGIMAAVHYDVLVLRG